MDADSTAPARGDDDEDGGDWGPFGRPLFDDPSARALSRVGVTVSVKGRVRSEIRFIMCPRA